MVYCHSTPPRLRYINKYGRFISAYSNVRMHIFRTGYLRSSSDIFLGIMGSQNVVYKEVYYYFR